MEVIIILSIFFSKNYTLYGVYIFLNFGFRLNRLAKLKINFRQVSKNIREFLIEIAILSTAKNFGFWTDLTPPSRFLPDLAQRARG